MSNQRTPWISLNSGNLTAEIDPLGAQLSVLRDREGRDLLWNGDPSVWAGRAPILFPIVGELASATYRLGTKAYHLSRHGFARGSMFQVLESSPSGAVFQLRADEATLQRYPFPFELAVQFALQGPSLSITARVGNLGDEDMPASFGYHPAFRWPLPFGRTRESHFIEFESEEPAPARRLNSQGLLAPERHPTPIVQRRLDLTDALFQQDVIIFDEVRSRFVTYGATDGPRIRVSFPDTPYLGLWSKPSANFICIEPWHGIADPEGYGGDFRAKPGVFTVSPGARAAFEMIITLLDR